MGIFGIGKKEKVIDLASSYNDEIKFNKAKGKALQGSTTNQGSSESSFAFLGNLASASSSSTSSDYNDPNISVEERRKRLAKRFMDMTDKIEDLSNQVYHLQQRIELLEKKTRTNES
jgi:chromosome segregation ATPase